MSSFILTIIIITSLPLLTKPPSNNNSSALNFKSECPFRYKKAIIKNLISHAKLISTTKTIFCKKIKNIKQTLINNGFPNYIVDKRIERIIFYRNQMHYNYKLDENISKTLVQRNILHTDPNK